MPKPSRYPHEILRRPCRFAGSDARANGSAAPRAWGRSVILGLSTFLCAGLLASPLLADSVWQPQGPAPNTQGQVEGIADREVSGAIHTVAAHPTDADTLYAGAVNGGIWRTTNSTAASPDWQELTDAFDSMAIGALEFDPTDATNQTLVAGTGSFSSIGGSGSEPVGILRTTDGGDTWSQIDGGGTLLDKRISGIAGRANILVVAVDSDLSTGSSSDAGIWRSTNTGGAWTQISSGNGAATGLPSGITDDLVGDPSDTTRLFTSVLFADSAGGTNGVYRSNNTGATWTKVSNAAMDALLISGDTSNVEFAVGNTNNVYAAIANNGRLAGLFRSGDSGNTWTSLDLPGNGNSIHQGGQAGIHMSIVADPTDANIVYLGGDRQSLPSDVGAQDFSGRLFRCNASLTQGSQCVHITHSSNVGPTGGGTANRSAPHADSREMVFDAGGELIESDDGGIYRRTSPRDNTGDWFSINGDIQTAEFHSAAYDSVANVPLAGSQDTGTSYQLTPGMTLFQSVSTGDGGKVAIDDSNGTTSTRYTSFQGLAAFRRSTFDASNTLTNTAFPSLTVVGGGEALQNQFYTPVVLNSTDPDRMIIGGNNSVYESLDQGDTITEIGPGIRINGTFYQPIIYGGAAGNDMLIVGSGTSVFRRTAAHPATLDVLASYPGDNTVRDLTVDPDAAAEIFAVEFDQVFGSTNTGDAWTELTGNLGSQNTGELRTLAFVPADSDMLVLGTERGTFYSRRSSDFTFWQPLGIGLPNVSIFELEYDATDDVLLASTLGRGAWTLAGPDTASEFFSDGFESGDVTRWSSSAGANP